MHATRVTRHISATPAVIYRALLDADSIAKWRVPSGVSGRVHEFEAREGGAYRISLSFDVPDGTGKTSTQTTTIRGRLVELVPDEKVVEAYEFEATAVPVPDGQMTTTTVLTEAAGGTDVLVVNEGLPDGLPAADNEASTRMVLDQLAALVEAGGDGS